MGKKTSSTEEGVEAEAEILPQEKEEKKDTLLELSVNMNVHKSVCFWYHALVVLSILYFWGVLHMEQIKNLMN